VCKRIKASSSKSVFFPNKFPPESPQNHQELIFLVRKGDNRPRIAPLVSTKVSWQSFIYSNFSMLYSWHRCCNLNRQPNEIDFLSEEIKMKNLFSNLLKRVTPVTLGLLGAFSAGFVILLAAAVSIK
jgi:hypothetical protein